MSKKKKIDLHNLTPEEELKYEIAEELGLLQTGDMTLEAAVTKIMWILGQTRDPDTIRSMFETTIRYDRMF